MQENTDFELLGSALGNALSSGVTYQQLIEAWYNSSSVTEWDTAIAAQGHLQMLQKQQQEKR